MIPTPATPEHDAVADVGKYDAFQSDNAYRLSAYNMPR